MCQPMWVHLCVFFCVCGVCQMKVVSVRQSVTCNYIIFTKGVCVCVWFFCYRARMWGCVSLTRASCATPARTLLNVCMQIGISDLLRLRTEWRSARWHVSTRGMCYICYAMCGTCAHVECRIRGNYFLLVFFFVAALRPVSHRRGNAFVFWSHARTKCPLPYRLICTEPRAHVR